MSVDRTYTFDLLDFNLDRIEIQKYGSYDHCSSWKFIKEGEPIVELNPADALFKGIEGKNFKRTYVPYESLSANQKLIGVYGYANRGESLVTIGFIVKEKVKK